MDSSESIPETFTIPAKPYDYVFPTASTALLMTDMQRDFLLCSSSGELKSGSELQATQEIVSHYKSLLDTVRLLGIPVFHTREGHLPDLSDCPSSKLVRQAAAPDSGKHGKVIGDQWAMGRFLIRGEHGHDLESTCRAKPWEVVIDKAGKGAFWNTTLHEELLAWGITHLIVAGATTECCVTTTVREANDRGFECCKF